MRRCCYILLLLVMLPFYAVAQGGCYPSDMQRLSDRGLIGTARYVSLAGAMVAVGGDPTAALDNPAGLGVYRRMEASATMDIAYDRTWQYESPKAKTRPAEGSPFAISHASWVFSFYSGFDQGVVANNLMISYRRLASYSRSLSMNGAIGTNKSFPELIAKKTTDLGVPEMDLKDDRSQWDYGWLSVLGYQNYLINPNGDRAYSSAIVAGEAVSSQMNVDESGSVNEYGLTWGMNMSNKLFVGVGLNIQSQTYRHEVQYWESYTDRGLSLSSESRLVTTGVGFNATLGLIYHPIQMLRLGASFQTPTYNRMTISNYGSMASNFVKVEDASKQSTLCETPTNNNTVSGMSLPLRASAGVALQLNRYGLVSLQYDYRHGKMTTDEHTFRAGVEGVIYNRFFLSAGYAYCSSFLNDDKQQVLVASNARDNNSVRTDTDFRHLRASQYISGGFGYRGEWGTAQLAYQYAWQRMDVYAHELADPFDIRCQTHRVVLTLNWHTR